MLTIFCGLFTILNRCVFILKNKTENTIFTPTLPARSIQLNYKEMLSNAALINAAMSYKIL